MKKMKNGKWKEKHGLPWDVFDVPKKLEKNQCVKDIRKKVIKSWDRIFSFSLDKEDYIQGVCWYFRKEEVKEVYFFMKTQEEIDKENEKKEDD